MLQLLNITYRYEDKPLLENLNLNLLDHEVLCLLGESGSGKSTLLRVIAGLENPEQGEILWNGASIQKMPPHQRNFGLMFQDYALFPHLDVYQNIAFGLRMKRMPEKEIDLIVRAKLVQIGMTAFAKRNVTELSGGEQQRVALARALAPEPHLLMLDEPLGALDHTLRVALLDELKDLLNRIGTSAIYVTHDHEEAFSIGDRVALLHDGVILQSDTPENLFRFPCSLWAARFLGQNNIIGAMALNEDQVRLDFGEKNRIMRLKPEYPLIAGQKINLLFRDESIQLRDKADDATALEGIVNRSIFKGNDFEIQIELSPEITFTVHRKYGCEPGKPIYLVFDPADLHIMLI